MSFGLFPKTQDMKLDAVRKLALSLPDTTEKPHHEFGSFRVKGRIFVTVPPDEKHIHVFVTEEQREVALATEPEFIGKLLWGGKVVGVRVNLSDANPSVVSALVRQAYEHKAASPPRRSTSRAPRSASKAANAKRSSPGAA